jgi:catechol 2,3-dioxygenase-like lactoylglutathione lyase family enzyme
MLDHIGLEVSDFGRSKAFYEAALAPLGIRLLMEFEGAAGLGKETEHGPKPFFWLHERGRTVVNGAPGLRPVYHPGYYGAFVLDPDGNNVEAVCHRAP